MAKTHVVKEGECIASIAFDHGFFPATVWNHPGNAGLREVRKLATVLRPGDSVHVPDLQRKEMAIASGARHRFRRKGVPERLQLRFVDHRGKPRASLTYELEIDGAVRTGTTGDDGGVREYVPPDARRGTITLIDQRGRHEHFQLQLGHLAPATEPTGASARLAQLGYACDDDAAMAASLRLFQREHGLSVTGENDPATQAKLVEVFGA